MSSSIDMSTKAKNGHNLDYFGLERPLKFLSYLDLPDMNQKSLQANLVQIGRAHV